MLVSVSIFQNVHLECPNINGQVLEKTFEMIMEPWIKVGQCRTVD